MMHEKDLFYQAQEREGDSPNWIINECRIQLALETIKLRERSLRKINLSWVIDFLKLFFLLEESEVDYWAIHYLAIDNYTQLNLLLHFIAWDDEQGEGKNQNQ